jgi:hypothetical protein
MKLVTALVALLFLAGAASADAGWFSGKKLPKPIDTPRVRPKADDSHKANKKQRHPPDYTGWSDVAVPGETARA